MDAQPLPREWNASTSSDYAFRYAHTRSSLQYLIKISRLGTKSVVNGLGIGDDKVHTMDIKVTDYLSESSFPYPLPTEGISEGGLSIRKAFISAGRVTDAASLLKLQIIQKLAPGLQKVTHILVSFLSLGTYHIVEPCLASQPLYVALTNGLIREC